MTIGPIQLSYPFMQAGLAGYSDRAMRLVARRRGCPYAVTEALLDVILCNGGEGLRKSLDINDEDHPVAGQLIGSEPETMAQAARLLHDAGYDVIDLNFACPVKKIKNKARGGHMLRDVERGRAILRAVRDAVGDEATLTVSLRKSFDDSAESRDMLWELLDTVWQHGCAAARVHARTVEQKYQGRATWDILRTIKSRYPKRTIIGSGDVFTHDDAVRMYRETGVDIVWIARGAIGNPWIFDNARRRMGNANISIDPPKLSAQREALTEHFELAMQVHGEQLAGRRMRKMGIKYSRFHPQAAEVKSDFINVHSLRDWQAVLERWYRSERPGVWPDERAADEVNEAMDTSCGM